MSDDITQTLRAVVPKMPESGTPIAWPVKVRSELLLEAAAEIERLRAEIDGLEAELALMKSGFEVAYRAMGDKP